MEADIDVIGADDEEETGEEPTVEPEADDDEAIDEETDEADEETDDPDPAPEPDPEPDQEEVFDVDEATAQRLRAEALEAERDHWRTTHDKLSGTHGDTTRRLRDKLKEAVGRIEELRGGVDEAPAPAPRASRDPRIDALVDDASDRKRDKARYAFADSVTEFERTATGGKPLPEDLKVAIRDHLAKHRDMIDTEIEAGDIRSTAIVTQRLLSEGLLRGINARQERNTERSGAQAKALRKQKELATPSGAAPKRGKPTRAKRPEDMTMEELEAFYRRSGRRGF